jgi:predicted nucleotidyltransferase
VIRQRVVSSLRALAESLGSKAEGSRWYLFGSVDRDEEDAADIDLMILCKSDDQADTLRKSIDLDALELPIHLALMTFDEEAEIEAVRLQQGCVVFP